MSGLICITNDVCFTGSCYRVDAAILFKSIECIVVIFTASVDLFVAVFLSAYGNKHKLCSYLLVLKIKLYAATQSVNG